MVGEIVVMPATQETKSPELRTVVDRAVGQLVSAYHTSFGSSVTLPVFYPSGAIVTLNVERAKAGYFVTDNGLAFREAEMVGGEAMFARQARTVAEQVGVTSNSRVVSAIADPEQLAGVLSDVASASARIAHLIIDKIANRHETDIADHIYHRLIALFGPPKVEAGAKIIGASTNEWQVSALVRLDGRLTAFDAVANHHSSVYSSATKFHDLALLDDPPVAVAVVRDKHALGPYYSILSQAGNVIQDNVPDETIRLAMAS